jgi:hypothetical protein
MAKEQTDSLGRVTGTSPTAQTVTGFAVEQGNLDGTDPGVKETLAQETRSAKAGRERAERVQEQMAPGSPGVREDDGGE